MSICRIQQRKKCVKHVEDVSAEGFSAANCYTCTSGIPGCYFNKWSCLKRNLPIKLY